MRAVSLVLWPAMVLLATPPIGAAQESGKTPRVAYVRSGSFAKDPYREAFLRGMRERGWIPGRNIAFEFRYYGDDAKAIPAMMQDLLRLKIDVITVGGAAATHAAQAATHSVPIVMVAGDPLGGGLITNLARPGSNTTGF
jgi:putative ABC transport system substrate-binding protein